MPDILFDDPYGTEGSDIDRDGENWDDAYQSAYFMRGNEVYLREGSIPKIKSIRVFALGDDDKYDEKAVEYIKSIGMENKLIYDGWRS